LAPTTSASEPTYLYKAKLVQAVPGKLLEVIDLLKASQADSVTIAFLGAWRKITVRIFGALCLLLFLPLGILAQEDLTRYVDPFIGTGGNGHTFPGATMPFGMLQLSPDTRLTGWDGCSGYHYSDHVLYGFSHTHLSGTGISDYGDILLMPTVGKLSLSNRDYASGFKHQDETARPGFYSVKLDNNVLVS